MARYGNNRAEANTASACDAALGGRLDASEAKDLDHIRKVIAQSDQKGIGVGGVRIFEHRGSSRSDAVRIAIISLALELREEES